MSRWTPDKRRHVFLALLAGTALAIAIYSTLITGLETRLRDRRQFAALIRVEWEMVLSERRLSVQKQELLRRRQEDKAALEARVPAADIYGWMNKQIRPLAETKYQWSSAELASVVAGEPQGPVLEPYGLAEFEFRGSASYRKLGEFVADLENTLPFVRLEKLTVQVAPAGLGLGSEAEQELSVMLRFVTLTMPSLREGSR